MSEPMSYTYNEYIEILAARILGEGSKTGLRVWDILGTKAKLSQVLQCGILFCPPLVEVDGMVLQCLECRNLSLDDKQARQIREMEREYAGDRETAQVLLNHVHIRDLFGFQGQDISEHEEHMLAHLLAGAWQGWLHLNFPDRQLIAKVLEAEETGDDLAISFYEVEDVLAGNPPA